MRRLRLASPRIAGRPLTSMLDEQWNMHAFGSTGGYFDILIYCSTWRGRVARSIQSFPFAFCEEATGERLLQNGEWQRPLRFGRIDCSTRFPCNAINHQSIHIQLNISIWSHKRKRHIDVFNANNPKTERFSTSEWKRLTLSNRFVRRRKLD